MKKIAIIGGGISGLATLHYLLQANPHLDITLYERKAQVGGCISSADSHGFVFETGPNGFLTNQPNTIEFIEELGLSNELIKANQASKRRYIQINGQLHLVPSSLLKFISTPLLSSAEKLRLLKGLFIKDISKEQSVYDYISKRFGEAVAKRLVDPFLTGIYAGDIKKLHMAHAFPKLGKAKGQREKPELHSFKNGMGSLIQRLYERYQPHIQTAKEITRLDQIQADKIICCTPAYITAQLLKLDVFNQIPYAPVAVVGLTFPKESFKTLPDGFGYLVPSGEGKDILGVLIESNVFPRTSKGEVFIRIMMGGAHHPEIVKNSEEQLIAKATQEIDQIYGLKGQPRGTVVKLWAQGIPQYELAYPNLHQSIAQELAQRPNIALCANYLDGISFNDCVKNAQKLAQRTLS